MKTPTTVLRITGILLVSFVLDTICLQTVRSENWPAWRGVSGLGISGEKELPTSWSPTNNVRWRVSLPEPGNSTPIVWNDRIFVTQARSRQNRRQLMCFARQDGRLLWNEGLTYTEQETTHGSNYYCSTSPVTDGEHVITWFGSAGVHCYDVQGKHLWSRHLGKQNHDWGYAASPLIYENLCIINFGPGEREFVIALNKQTGKTIWQVDALPPADEAAIVVAGTAGDAPADDGQFDPASRAKSLRGSWSTPLLIRAEGRDELIVSHPRRITGYDPLTGRELWTCRGLGPLIYSSPIAGEGILISMGGYFGGSLAVRSGGHGDVTRSHRLWHKQRSPLWLGCGVVHAGHIYIHNMRSVMQCLELATGEVRWEKRQSGSASSNETWSSLLLCNGNIYHMNQSGDTFVFRASPDYKLMSVNSLKESTNSSIAASQGELFIRTHESLWCISPE